MKSQAFAAIVAAFLAVGAIPAAAQHMNAPEGPCASTVSATCNKQALETSDRDLNRLYHDVSTMLRPADRERLQQLERSWISYRDTFCAAEYALYAGGSGGPAARFACLDALTRHQIGELKSAYGWKLAKSGPAIRGRYANTDVH